MGFIAEQKIRHVSIGRFWLHRDPGREVRLKKGLCGALMLPMFFGVTTSSQSIKSIMRRPIIRLQISHMSWIMPNR